MMEIATAETSESVDTFVVISGEVERFNKLAAKTDSYEKSVQKRSSSAAADEETADKVKEISTMVNELDISAINNRLRTASSSNGAHDDITTAAATTGKVDETCQIPDVANKTTWTSIDEDNNNNHYSRSQQTTGDSVVDADTQIEPELIRRTLQETAVKPEDSSVKIRKTCQEQQTDTQLADDKETLTGGVADKRDVDETEMSTTDSDMVISSLMAVHNEEENARLVNQSSESFEEELPYVPTTLPLERSVAVPIIPVKERVVEVKTCPVHRPRSRMPLNAALLEKYVADTSTTSTSTTTTVVVASSVPTSSDGASNLPVATENLPHSSPEKLHIILPRSEPASDTAKVKSPLTMKPWKKFIEEVPQSPKKKPPSSKESPPPLPPKKLSSGSWISFDEANQEVVRQSPKKITTLPSSHYAAAAESAVNLQKAVNRFSSQKMIFVNPDECSCECHEPQRTLAAAWTTTTTASSATTTTTTTTTIVTTTTTIVTMVTCSAEVITTNATASSTGGN